jgi:hypothetical protein
MLQAKEVPLQLGNWRGRVDLFVSTLGGMHCILGMEFIVDAPPSSLCDPKRVQRIGFAEMVRNLVPFPTSNTKRGSVATLLWPSVGVKPNTWKELGFGVLRDSRMFRVQQQGAKHLALGCS